MASTELKSIFIELGNALVPFIINSVQLHKSQLKSIRFENVTNEIEADKLRTQEEILRDSGYPEETMEEHSNFWGLKPPN